MALSKRVIHPLPTHHFQFGEHFHIKKSFFAQKHLLCSNLVPCTSCGFTLLAKETQPLHDELTFLIVDIFLPLVVSVNPVPHPSHLDLICVSGMWLTWLRSFIHHGGKPERLFANLVQRSSCNLHFLLRTLLIFKTSE